MIKANDTFIQAAKASHSIGRALNAFRAGKASSKIGFTEPGTLNRGLGRLWVQRGTAEETGFKTWSGAETMTDKIDLNVLPTWEKVKLNAPGVYALKRSDTPGRDIYAMNGNKAFTCGEGFAIKDLQPRDILGVEEEIEDLVKILTLGYFDNGERSWASYLIKSWEPVPGDVVNQYATRACTVNGTLAGERYGISMTAIECSNTFTHAISDCKLANKRTKYAAQRSAGLRSRLADMVARAAGFEEFTRALTKKRMTDENWETLKDIYAPRKFKGAEDVSSARTRNVRDELDRMLLTSPGQQRRLSATGRSLYTGLNALTYFASNEIGTRVTGSHSDTMKAELAQQQRLDSVLFGKQAQVQAQVQSVLVSMLQAA
jgi:hypothetical protein